MTKPIVAGSGMLVGATLATVVTLPSIKEANVGAQSVAFVCTTSGVATVLGANGKPGTWKSKPTTAPF
jgi:hypothetical protein